MEDTSDTEESNTSDDNLVVDVDSTKLADSAAAFREVVTVIDKAAYTDKRQKGGRWAPIFPCLLKGTKKEEEYIERMLRRDKQYDRRPLDSLEESNEENLQEGCK